MQRGEKHIGPFYEYVFVVSILERISFSFSLEDEAAKHVSDLGDNRLTVTKTSSLVGPNISMVSLKLSFDLLYFNSTPPTLYQPDQLMIRWPLTTYSPLCLLTATMLERMRFHTNKRKQKQEKTIFIWEEI